jgi:hypothetical protein
MGAIYFLLLLVAVSIAQNTTTNVTGGYKSSGSISGTYPCGAGTYFLSSQLICATCPANYFTSSDK